MKFQISSGKVAFYFPSKNIYLFNNNDDDDDVENAQLKELFNVLRTNGGSVHNIVSIEYLENCTISSYNLFTFILNNIF